MNCIRNAQNRIHPNIASRTVKYEVNLFESFRDEIRVCHEFVTNNLDDWAGNVVFVILFQRLEELQVTQCTLGGTPVVFNHRTYAHHMPQVHTIIAP
jgi:hypothetical protein